MKNLSENRGKSVKNLVFFDTDDYGFSSRKTALQNCIARNYSWNSYAMLKKGKKKKNTGTIQVSQVISNIFKLSTEL